MSSTALARLDEVAPDLARILSRSAFHSSPLFAVNEISCVTTTVAASDGTCLATDLYLPPSTPAPAIALRTPYGRGSDVNASVLLSMARRGFVAVGQDCRGTGESEPDQWDYYVYEPEDSYDLVEWISRQDWFNGFLAGFGESYAGQTQWQMAMHPRMSAISPGVSGLGIATNTLRLHMFVNAYGRSVGHGAKTAAPYQELEAAILEETLTTGYFNEPLEPTLSTGVLTAFPALRDIKDPRSRQRWLWDHYCSLTSASRAELLRRLTGSQNISIVDVETLPKFFGQHISHDRHTLPYATTAGAFRSLSAPVLLRTGWYDWGLNDALATWQLLMTASPNVVRERSRLFISPSAHSMPGYHEGMVDHPELHHAYRTATNLDFLLRWYAAIQNDSLESWPRVIYYLMGANMWMASDAWPPHEVSFTNLYLAPGGGLSSSAPTEPQLDPDPYTYDPTNPTPTVGGSILSYVYPPGSVDVRDVQRRTDVVTYTSDVLASDVDVVGPLQCVLYASSSTVDTDFVVRLSDVFPDGRAIQLQNGALRARFRHLDADATFLEPHQIYRFDIDMWATANRFHAGHRIRIDISSADFPRFDRNSNRGGDPGPPLPAEQHIYRDATRPSHLVLPTISTA